MHLSDILADIRNFEKMFLIFNKFLRLNRKISTFTNPFYGQEKQNSCDLPKFDSFRLASPVMEKKQFL